MVNAIKMKAANESFLLLNPNPQRNSHEIAKVIAACKGVKKVFITSGEFGFVVSTVEGGKNDCTSVGKLVKKVSGAIKTRAVRGHFVYSQAK